MNRSGSAVQQVFGSSEEFISEYQNFEELYKRALRQELQSTAISAGQRRMISAAIGAPVINLNLIRNVKERQNLVNHLNSRVMPMEAVVKSLGSPSAAMPSANLYRSSSRYLVDQRSDNIHPALVFMNSLTFNTDPTKSGASAIKFGVSNLPSVKALKNSQQMAERIAKKRNYSRTFEYLWDNSPKSCKYNDL